MTLLELKNHDIVLENSIIRLEPLAASHFEELKKIALDPQLWTIALTSIVTNNDLNKYIEIALAEKASSQSYTFIIIDKASGEIAGSTRYMSFSPSNMRLEIGGTWLQIKFQGKGINKPCKYELLKYAFTTLHLNRVELKTDVINQQSRKAILKIGAKEEGIFRKHQVTASGRVRDSVYYGIIKEEWPEIEKTIFNKGLFS